ncbi:hypothetical protein B0H19DRAFT_1163131 [Mycena capillaripes]|nr:hypothetical protein B0H19DRAFT_1163131 [Mycena capillaripes]
MSFSSEEAQPTTNSDEPERSGSNRTENSAGDTDSFIDDTEQDEEAAGSDLDRTENSAVDTDSLIDEAKQTAEEAREVDALFTSEDEAQPAVNGDDPERSDLDRIDYSVGDADSFIDDTEQTAEEPEEVEAFFASKRNAHRILEEHFIVFIEYITQLRSEPNFLSTASQNRRMCVSSTF